MTDGKELRPIFSRFQVSVLEGNNGSGLAGGDAGGEGVGLALGKSGDRATAAVPPLTAELDQDPIGGGTDRHRASNGLGLEPDGSEDLAGDGQCFHGRGFRKRLGR